MNLKTAKFLRGFARAMAHRRNLPWHGGYVLSNERVRAYPIPYAMAPNGLPMYVEYETATARLVPQSGRAMYQQAKRSMKR